MGNFKKIISDYSSVPVGRSVAEKAHVKRADAVEVLKRSRVEFEGGVDAHERLPARGPTLHFDAAHFWDKPGLMDAFMEKDRDSSPDPPSSPFALSDILPLPPPSLPSFTLHTPASFDRRSDASSSTTPSPARSTHIPHEIDTPSFSLSDSARISFVRQTSPPACPPTEPLVYERSTSRKKSKSQGIQLTPATMNGQRTSRRRPKATITPVRKTASDPLVTTSSVRVIRSPPPGNSPFSTIDTVDRDNPLANENGDSTAPHSKCTKKSEKKTKAKVRARSECQEANKNGEIDVERQEKCSMPALTDSDVDQPADESTVIGVAENTSPTPMEHRPTNSKLNFLCEDPGPKIEVRQVLSADLRARYEMLHARMKMEAEASWENFEFEGGTADVK